MQVTVQEAYDQGLRNYMTSIFNWMIIGVLVSAAGAYLGVMSGLPAWFAVHKGTFLIAAFAPLGIILWMGAAMRQGSIGFLRIGYLAIAALEGFTMTPLLSKVGPEAVATAFVSASAGFAALSLWGYTTRRNLGPIGNFLFFALFGLIAAMLLNVFFPMPGMDNVINYAGVLIFAGLIAYDTQKLKDAYSEGLSEDMKSRIVIWGALDLYLDFLNLFLFLLRIFGSSDNKN